MPTQKRKRKRTGQQARQSAYEARRRKSRRRQGAVAAVLIAILILGVAAIVTGGGGDDPTDVATQTSTSVGPVSVPPAETVSGHTSCPAPDGSSPRTTSFTEVPPMCIDPDKTYMAEIKTNKGTMLVTLDAKAAPVTVNNFVVLSRYHFYDGVSFHRIIPGFVVQGGDPQGTGTGGPGYQFGDELPKPPARYEEGSLAMANSGPSTNGSQFFIITGPRGAALPPNYSLFGKVTEGFEVAKAIEAVGTPEGGPKEPIIMESVTIRET